MSNNTDTTVIIVAAGSGSRFGSPLPKQFCNLAGRPILSHTVERFKCALPDARIITVLSGPMIPYWQEVLRKHPESATEIVTGGSSRWESVRNALVTLPPRGRVLIHDAARPLVSSQTILNVLESISNGKSSIPVYPVTDSLRLLGDNNTSQPVDRASYRAVATPQGFMTTDLQRAYEQPYRESFTDDASVMAAAAMPGCTLIESNPTNIKITNPADIASAEWCLENEPIS